MNESLVNIEIDGKPLQAQRGANIMEVADAAGIFIPRFCYHKKLPIAANCRMCLVEVEKAPKTLPACATPVMEGMKIHTRSDAALHSQKAVMEFLLINHPLDCPICDQGGECELQDLSLGYGNGVSRFAERKRVIKDQDIGPLIATDMTRCIECTRCVRFCEHVAGVVELGQMGRGEHVAIGTYIEHSIDNELSGNVIDLCPVGALTSKPFRFQARAWEMQQRDAIAPHDPIGSNLQVHVRRSRVLRVVPRENEALNEVWLSDRDRFSYAGLYSEDRLTTPRVKRDGVWADVDWETALEAARDGLRRIVDDQGAQALGALTSPSATVEEHYLMQRLMRGLGSSNIDHRLRQSDFSDDPRAPLYPGLGQAFAAIERADAVLLIGANPRKEHPLLNHRLRKAVQGGAAVMTVGALDFAFNYPLAERRLVSAARMAVTVAGIGAHLAGGDEMGKLLDGVEPDPTEKAIAARLQSADRPLVLLGPGALSHPRAATLRALAAAIARGAGAPLGVLTEGANCAGAWLAGAVPHRGASGTVLTDPGLNVRAMLDGGISGFVLLGIEPELDCADGAAALAAMDKAQLVVALTAYSPPRMEAYADVMLPIAGFAETEGTYVNLDGTWQSFAAAVQPPGEARPAWRILRVLGNYCELSGFGYTRADEVRGELRALVDQAPPADFGAVALPDSLDADAGGTAIYRIGNVPIYATDPLVRRAPALQATRDARQPALAIGPALADQLGVAAGDTVRVGGDGAARTLKVTVDAAVADGCAWIPAGVEASIDLGPSYGPIEIVKE